MTGSFIQGLSIIAVSLTLILRISSTTDPSTSVAEIVVEFNRVDAADGGNSGDDKLVKKLSKKSKKLQRSQKVTQVIGLEECLLSRNLWTEFKSFSSSFC